MNFNFDTGLIDTIQTIDCSVLPPLGGTAGVLTILGNGALVVNTGNTAERPGSPVGGMFRWNSQTTLLEYYNGTTWETLSTSSGSVTSVDISTTSGPAVVVGGGPITSTGTLTVDVSDSLQALSTLGSGGGTGIVVKTGTDTFAQRTIVGTASNISVTNGDGVAGNPTIDLINAGTPVSNQFVKITTDAKGRVTATTAVGSSDITTALGYTPVNKAGDTNVGSLSMDTGADITLNGGTVTGLPTPTAATDAASKEYVDSFVAGFVAHEAVRAASLVNLDVTKGGSGVGATLTANANGALVLDGVTVDVGDRVLIKDQTAAEDNGIYIVTDDGDGSNPFVLTRSPDFDDSPDGEVAAGDFVFVEDGTIQSNTGWVVYVPGNADIDFETDPVNWTQFTGAGSIALSFAADGGTPVTLVSGQTLNIVGTSNQISTAGDGTNTISLILEQDIDIGADVTFASLTLSSLAANGVVTTDGASQLVSTALTDGQILIGSTGNPAVATTITGGTAISVTNGAGSITINNTGVTSLAGTANQISVSAATGAVTLSIPSTFIAPGSIEATTTLQVTGNIVNSFVYSNASKQVVTTAAPTNGQLLIGSTGGAPVVATLTAGTGIGIVNGAGTITINNAGVTSVALSDGSSSPIYSISGSPVTTTGTLTFTLISQAANTVFAAPNGSSGQPTFRALTLDDLAGALQLYTENPVTPTTPVASGDNAVAIGSGATATADGSTAIGDGSNATVLGGFVTANGAFATAGDAQAGIYVLRAETTDDTLTEMFLDGVGEQLVFPNNSVVTFDILVAARRTDATGGGAGYRFVGAIRKDATAGSNTLIGGVSKTVLGETNSPWNATLTADTTDGNLKIEVEGQVAKTIRWVATVRTAEVTN